MLNIKSLKVSSRESMQLRSHYTFTNRYHLVILLVGSQLHDELILVVASTAWPLTHIVPPKEARPWRDLNRLNRLRRLPKRIRSQLDDLNWKIIAEVWQCAMHYSLLFSLTMFVHT